MWDGSTPRWPSWLPEWTPLRRPAFRGLWAGSGVYFTANAMQVMAASWLMVELTGLAGQ
jgi:hypothetical protein